MGKNNTLMQSIHDAASKLKGCKLKKLNLIAPALKRVGEELGIDSQEEQIVFVAMFDRQCAGCSTDMVDISNYLGCTALEAMQFVPSINNLISKGFVTVSNPNQSLLTRKDFMICSEIQSAIIENKAVEPVPVIESDDYDQFDFCHAVSKIKEDRKQGVIETRKLFFYVEKLEKEHAELPLISSLKEIVGDIESRTLFYEMCNDTVVSQDRFGRNPSTDIDETLKDFYDKILLRASVKASILNETHPLIVANLIRQTDDNEIKLTRKGMKLLYGDKCDAVLKSCKVADRYEFVKRIDKLVDDLPPRVDTRRRVELFEEILQLEADNAELSLVSRAQTLVSEDDTTARLIFYLVSNELVDGNTYHISRISDFCKNRECAHLKSEIKEGSHPLVKKGIVEVSGGGHFDSAQLQLTNKGKEIFLEEDIDLFETKVSDNELIMPDKIDEKQLFFEKGLQEQLSMLRESLAEENYQKLYNRLAENKLSKGVAILFYGKPGTGKTETAKQIARATGRAIMHVDISATKTCWFGESEKLIKEVFTNYKRLCEKSKIKPILLFNEADAVFSKRKDSNSSNVAQTENAIQNIILEEMENLDGILIATTNLADNLDNAFERRFLFKIRYDNPTIEAKKNIWKDKLPLLSESEAEQLAATYDFSGGQIDNIVRKSLMEEVIKGESPTLPTLMAMCAHEKISGNGRTKIGF